MAFPPTEMRTLWLILVRTIFWSYERGTWQYDIAVLAIVLFVLLTPRRWFHDEPQVGGPEEAGKVLLVSDTGTARTYRVDAQALAPPKRTPELASDLHGALQKAVPELQGKRFTILRIEVVRNAGGAVTAYDVQVEQ
jgi:hypothetical protein